MKNNNSRRYYSFNRHNHQQRSGLSQLQVFFQKNTSSFAPISRMLKTIHRSIPTINNGIQSTNNTREITREIVTQLIACMKIRESEIRESESARDREIEKEIDR